MVAGASFDPEEFLTLATVLLNQPEASPEEARYRTVVNRCYLTAYLRARAAVERLEGPFTEDADSYFRVEEALEKRQCYLGRVRLQSLRVDRADADYRMFKPVKRRKAELAIDSAKTVLQELTSSLV
jgi:hypothetical protein